MPKLLKISIIIIFVLIFMLVCTYIAFGPPQLIQKTEVPTYCASCHYMESQYEAWFHSGSHKQIKCVDCHLPNNNIIEHYIEKGYTGMRDLFGFYTNTADAPHEERLAGEEKGEPDIVQENCIRCHEEMVSRINVNDRKCWFCHRNVIHSMPSFYMKHYK